LPQAQSAANAKKIQHTVLVVDDGASRELLHLLVASHLRLLF
jgi:hypothetical protein